MRKFYAVYCPHEWMPPMNFTIQRLLNHFRKDKLSIVHSITASLPFETAASAIMREMLPCDVVLVFVGQEWKKPLPSWVQTEIELALALGKRIVTLVVKWYHDMVDELKDLPAESELPIGLRPLHKYPIHHIRHNTGLQGWAVNHYPAPFFEEDMEWLMILMEQVLEADAPEPTVLAEKALETHALVLRDARDILPAPFDWAAVPAGRIYGEADETIIPGFSIGRYPITVAQYRVFLEAEDGYENSAWWENLSLRAASSYHYARESAALQGSLEARFFRKAARIQADDEAIELSWYDAMAFCKWLASRTGLPISLPSRAQWHRAAFGDSDQPYPWGSQAPNSELTNWSRLLDRKNLQTLDKMIRYPVTGFPLGASIYGVEDILSNTMEWGIEGHWESGHSFEFSDETRCLLGFGTQHNIPKIRCTYSQASSWKAGLRLIYS